MRLGLKTKVILSVLAGAGAYFITSNLVHASVPVRFWAGFGACAVVIFIIMFLIPDKK